MALRIIILVRGTMDGRTKALAMTLQKKGYTVVIKTDNGTYVWEGHDALQRAGPGA